MKINLDNGNILLKTLIFGDATSDDYSWSIVSYTSEVGDPYEEYIIFAGYSKYGFGGSNINGIILKYDFIE